MARTWLSCMVYELLSRWEENEGDDEETDALSSKEKCFMLSNFLCLDAG